MRNLRLATVLGLAAALVLPGGAYRAQEDAPRAATAPGAAAALEAAVTVEKTLLQEDLARFEKASAERTRSAARLEDLYAALDAALLREDAQAVQAIDELFLQIDQGERERSALLAAERSLLERIRERMHRIDLLDQQVDDLEARAAEAAGPLTARWDVLLLPTGQRGSFVLLQAGTIVSGTYVLEGGWSGSLRGTLVNRKVYLERIDSKLGRSGEFEGYLSGDGTQIRGTWLRHDVAAEGGASGQWSATRRVQGQ